MSSKSGNADAKRRKKYSNRKSCFHCHRLHLSCDGGRPCSRCVKGERAASCISSDEEQFNLAGKCVKDSDQNLLKMDRTNFELKSEIQRLKFQIETLRSKVESVPFVENSRSFEFPIGNSSTTVLSFREDVMLESVESQRLSNLDSFEWDTFYPDFFSKRSEGISLKRNEDVQKLHSSIWNPSISVASQFEEVSKPFSSQINYPFSITSESFNQTHTKLLKDDEVSLVEKAKQILVSLGATNHYMKIKLYAHCVTFRGRLVLCNDEFLKLCRTDHREDVLGRSIKDFNPPAMNQLVPFLSFLIA